MKVALVLPGSIWYAPYVRIYTRLLEKYQIHFDIISWNREGDDLKEGFQYQNKCTNGHCSASFIEYYGYIKFVKRTIKREKYDKVIVFGPQMTCLLSTFLLLNYKGKYLIDYRDLSIEQKRGFKQLFALMLNYSFANVISSPGFATKLPNRYYYMSHNFDVNAIKEVLKGRDNGTFMHDEHIDVLTIGAIRDYSSNIEVVRALGNRNNITLRFVGKGDAAHQIEEYCKEHNINNIIFKGFYRKEEEAGYVKSATFLNIFYPRVVTHDTALSNRFYISLQMKKPMIVTKDTTQGYYAENFGVGIAVTDCDNLESKLHDFLKQDYKQYEENCNRLLGEFLKDENEFQDMVKKFINQ